MNFKFLFGAILTSMLLFLPACKNAISKVDVFDLAEEMSPEKFESTEVRSRTVVRDARMIIDEWRITDVEKKSIEHVQRVWGDGADVMTDKKAYIYEQVGLDNSTLGIKYLFTGANAEEKLDVLYWGNGFVVGEDTITDGAEKISKLNAIVESFPGHTWFSRSSVDTIFNDTIAWDTVYVKNVKNYDENGKLIGVKKDTVVESIKHTFVTKLPFMLDTCYISFNRDETSNKNALNCLYIKRAYKYEKIERIVESETVISPINKQEIVKVKSVKYVSDAVPELVEKELEDNWYLYSITSATRFGISHNTVVDDEDLVRYVPEKLMLSGFDLNKGVLKIGETSYTLVKD